MQFLDGKMSTVVSLVVGTGGVTKGDLVVLSSGTVVRAAAAATAATVLGLATASAVDTAMCSIELCGDRIIRSEYTGTGSNLATNKIYDLSDAHTIAINDVTGGSCYCVDFDATKGVLDFIVTVAQRAI